MSRPSVSVGLTRARRRLRELATAIGALGLLPPLGVRRLVERISRRANTALATGQQVLLGVAEQAGAVAAGLLAGLVSMSAGAPAAVAAPGTALAAYHGPDRARAAAEPQPAALGRGLVATTATSSAAPRTAGPAPSQPAFAPAINQTASVLPGGSATPDDIWSTSVTPSPGFDQDGIAFMVGDVRRGCSSGSCPPAAFRTDNTGASWTRVWPATFPGGTVLLSPRFPADPAVFVVSPSAGLLVDRRGDGTFTTAVPRASAAAVAPDSPLGRARLVAATDGVLARYTVGDAALTPGPVLPTGMTATGLVFTAPDQVLVAGWSVTADSTGNLVQRAMLVSCSLSLACGLPTTLPGHPSVVLMSTGAFSSPLLAYDWSGALVSTDGGASFRPVLATPRGQTLKSAGLGVVSGTTRLVFSFSDLATQRHTTVSYSDDLGATLHDATGDLAATSYAVAARVLGNGNLLVGLTADATGRFALEESTGTGHWSAPRTF
jgi:hypothetical protein